jgi:hypothetical protein
VPIEFADRDGQPALEKADLQNLVKQSGGPLLFVNVSNANFKNDGRAFDPASPPSDAKVLRRFEKSWQLRRLHNEQWSQQPTLFPRTLIGLFGPREAKIVIGAVKIDCDSAGHWKCSKRNFFHGGLMQAPVRLSDNRGLDAMKLRGRRVAAEKISLLFGRARHQFFQIFPPPQT